MFPKDGYNITNAHNYCRDPGFDGIHVDSMVIIQLMQLITVVIHALTLYILKGTANHPLLHFL